MCPWYILIMVAVKCGIGYRNFKLLVICVSTRPCPDAYGTDNGSVPATFQMLHFIGWKPDKSQAQPAPRGSATASLKDISVISKRQGNKESNT